jgi:hypothetical protein
LECWRWAAGSSRSVTPAHEGNRWSAGVTGLNWQANDSTQKLSVLSADCEAHNHGIAIPARQREPVCSADRERRCAHLESDLRLRELHAPKTVTKTRTLSRQYERLWSTPSLSGAATRAKSLEKSKPKYRSRTLPARSVTRLASSNIITCMNSLFRSSRVALVPRVICPVDDPFVP